MFIRSPYRYLQKTLHTAVLLMLIGWMSAIKADVKGDFELGSGGMKVVAIEGMMTTTIYVLMCVFGGWVMVNSVRKLIDADETKYYEIFGLVFRAMLILIVMILVLT